MARNRGLGSAGEPLKRCTVYIPVSLLNRVDLLLLDPSTGKVKYGSKSALFEHLLRQWLSEEHTFEPTESS